MIKVVWIIDKFIIRTFVNVSMMMVMSCLSGVRSTDGSRCGN